MLSSATHRKQAREYLARADAAPTHDRKVKYLRLAVTNSVRAQQLEARSSKGTAARRKAVRI